MPDDAYTQTVTPEVQPTSGLTPDATPDAFGARIGEVANQAAMVQVRLGRDRARQAEQAQEKADHTQALAGSLALDQFQVDQHNPDSGIFAKPPPAPEYHAKAQEVLGNYDKLASATALGMANDQQREKFGFMAAAKRQELEQNLFHGENQETTKYANQVDVAKVQSATTLGTLNAANPDMALQQLAIVKATIAESGKRNRLPPEAIDANQTQAASAYHMSIMGQLIATDHTPQAQAWYNVHKGELDAADSEKAARMVETASTAVQAKQINADLMKDENGKPATEAQWFANLQKNDVATDPDKIKTYEQVVQQGREFFGLKKNADNAQQFDISNRIQNGIVKDPARDPSKWVSPQEWETLDGATKQAMLNQHMQAIRKDAPPDGTVDYYDLRTLAAEKPEAFKNANLFSYADKVSPKDFKEMFGLQQEMKSGKDAGGKMTEITTKHDIVQGILGGIGLDDSRQNLSPEQKSQKLKFLNEMDSAAKYWSLTHDGKQPSPQDLTDMGAKLVGKTYEDQARGWYNPAGWVGSSTTKTDTGFLFERPHNMVADELAKDQPSTPTITPDEMQQWRTVLMTPGPQRDASVEKLKRWQKGIGEDGRADPNLRQRYLAVRALLDK